MAYLCRVAAALSLLLVFTFSDAAAQRRFALVVGNSSYAHAPDLSNTLNDAVMMAALLERVGFQVTLATNVTHRQFGRTVASFAASLDGDAEIALFFYAGHALQVGGVNYLVPVDARLEREAGLEFEAVRLDTVLRVMEVRAGTNVVLLDACRDNPLARSLVRSMGTRSTAVGKGLAQIETGVGSFIGYATQPGNVALDGTGPHSPFTAALLKHAETPGLDLEALMRRVRREVIAATGGAQVPWTHSSLTTTVSIAAHAVSTQAPATQGAADRSYDELDPRALELSFWESVRDGGSVTLLQEYLRRYPQGVFAAIAQEKVKQLLQQDAEARVARLAPADATDKDQAQMSGRELSRAVQQELRRVGCDPGPADGMWGRRSRAALARFNRYAEEDLPAASPSPEVLQVLRTAGTQVCPQIATVAPRTATADPAERSAAERTTSGRPSGKTLRGRKAAVGDGAGASCRAGSLAGCRTACSRGFARACMRARCLRGNKSACAILRGSRRR